MGMQKSAVAHLNQGLRIFFSEFVRVSLRHPSQALFFARTVLWQGTAARRRALPLVQKLGADIRKCREDADLAVLGRQEGDFDEEVDFYSEISRLRLSDPLRVELWWRYHRAFEKASSARTILLEARRSLREIGRKELARGRPAHVAFEPSRSPCAPPAGRRSP